MRGRALEQRATPPPCAAGRIRTLKVGAPCVRPYRCLEAQRGLRDGRSTLSCSRVCHLRSLDSRSDRRGAFVVLMPEVLVALRAPPPTCTVGASPTVVHYAARTSWRRRRAGEPPPSPPPRAHHRVSSPRRLAPLTPACVARAPLCTHRGALPSPLSARPPLDAHRLPPRPPSGQRPVRRHLHGLHRARLTSSATARAPPAGLLCCGYACARYRASVVGAGRPSWCG